MAELETNGSGSTPGDFKDCATSSDGPDLALRARNDLEQVAIETVQVGDHVLVDVRALPVSARCVIKKCAKANERTARVVGWLLELTGGHLAWWPRGGLVWRRRAPFPARALTAVPCSRATAATRT
jgi:hypothetical protein